MTAMGIRPSSKRHLHEMWTRSKTENYSQSSGMEIYCFAMSLTEKYLAVALFSQFSAEPETSESSGSRV